MALARSRQEFLSLFATVKMLHARYARLGTAEEQIPLDSHESENDDSKNVKRAFQRRQRRQIWGVSLGLVVSITLNVYCLYLLAISDSMSYPLYCMFPASIQKTDSYGHQPRLRQYRNIPKSSSQVDLVSSSHLFKGSPLSKITNSGKVYIIVRVAM